MSPVWPVIEDSPSSRFEEWQLADELATGAERGVCDAFSSSVAGTGPIPTQLQLDISHSMRITAKRLLHVALRDIPVIALAIKPARTKN